MKIPKQTPPNKDPLLIPFLEGHSSAYRPPERHQPDPIKMPLDSNSRSRIKSDRPIRIQKAAP
ncbi:hypothetical protein A2U01_0102220, partial [Trifolium medium]|nr:hypothetical protein [Trifolium medium]